MPEKYRSIALERVRNLLYSKSIGSSEVVLLKLKSREITFNTIEDLKPYKIGSIRSSRVSDAFDASENELQIVYATDTLPHIKKLLAGRLDLVVEKKTACNIFWTRFSRSTLICWSMYGLLSTPTITTSEFPERIPKARGSSRTSTAD